MIVIGFLMPSYVDSLQRYLDIDDVLELSSSSRGYSEEYQRTERGFRRPRSTFLLDLLGGLGTSSKFMPLVHSLYRTRISEDQGPVRGLQNGSWPIRWRI